MSPCPPLSSSELGVLGGGHGKEILLDAFECQLLFRVLAGD